MTYDELRLQQLLGPFNRPQGIASLSQAASPLSFQYVDQLYPDLQSSDVGYSIAPSGSADEGYAIGPYGTADDLISTGFYGSPDMGFPFAPANRLGGLDLDRFQGVSELGRQDEDVEQVEYLPGQEPSGIEKLINKVSSIPGVVGTGISALLGKFNPVGLFASGLGSLRNLNQKLRATDFGQSKTLQEYFERKKQRDQAKRAQEANKSVYESAKKQGFTNDRGGFSTTSADKAGTSLGSGQFSPSTSRGRSGY